MSNYIDVILQLPRILFLALENVKYLASLFSHRIGKISINIISLRYEVLVLIVIIESEVSLSEHLMDSEPHLAINLAFSHLLSFLSLNHTYNVISINAIYFYIFIFIFIFFDSSSCSC